MFFFITDHDYTSDRVAFFDLHRQAPPPS